MKARSILFLALFCSLLLNAQSHSKQLKSLDQFIKDGIEKWQPPGLAVTVVKDGEIIFTKGYGAISEVEDTKKGTQLTGVRSPPVD